MPAIRSSSSWVSPSSMPDRHPRSLSKNQVKPDKDLRRESDSRVFKISGKTPHCLVKQCHKLLSAKVLILGQAPRKTEGHSTSESNGMPFCNEPDGVPLQEPTLDRGLGVTTVEPGRTSK